MEEVLKNIGTSKTFSVSRHVKKLLDDKYRGIDEIPAPMTVSSGKKPEMNNKEAIIPVITTTTVGSNLLDTDSNFADFIANDQNIFNQRKILLHQEKLQKQSIAAFLAAANTKKLNTKGLLQDDSEKDDVQYTKEADVITWSQYENDAEMALRLQKYYEKKESSKGSTTKRSRFWSAFFSETRPKSSESRKRRIFAEPAYVLHLSILKVRDEREHEAIAILKEKLASLSLLKKTDLKGMVNELFLRALDKGYEDLVILLMDSGFPDSFNHSIYGDPKSRRFPSYLLLAIGLGRLRVVQRMLEMQPKIQLNRGWFNGIRPLMMAQMIKKVPGKSLLMTQLLLKHGAEPNRSISYTTYLKGITFRQLKASKMVTKMKRSTTDEKIKKGKKVPRGRKDIYRNSRLCALDFACSREKYESAHLILSRNVKNDWLAKNEFCLLKLNNFELAADILQRAPELIKQRDPRGNTPLHYAAKHGRTDLIALYIRYTKNINVLNWMHWTPLHEAANGAHRAAVQYLIKCGADCSIKNIEGSTALQLARSHGISSEELYDFFHSADTIQRTQQLLGKLVIPEIKVPKTEETGGSRILIQKFMKYPRKLWKKSFKFT